MNCKRCGNPLENSSTNSCNTCEMVETKAKDLLEPFIKIIYHLMIIFIFLILFRAFFPPGEGTVEFQIVTSMGLLIGIAIILFRIELERRDIVKGLREFETKMEDLGVTPSSTHRIGRIALLLGLDHLLLLAGIVLVIIAIAPLTMALILLETTDAFLFILPYAVGIIGIGTVILIVAWVSQRRIWKNICDKLGIWKG